MYLFIRKQWIVYLIAVFSAFLFSAKSATNNEVLASAKEKGKLVAQDYLSRSTLPNSSSFNYFDACSYYGASMYGEADKDSVFYKSVYTRYKNSKPSSIPTGDVDKNSCGLIPLHLFTISNDSSLLKLGKAPADAVVQATYPQQNLNTGSVYVRTAIDDTYMVGSLMVQAFRATHDTGYLDFCAEYITYYIGKLQQPNGLYWHKLDSKNFWGRGNGWGAASTTELLLVLPKTHEKYAAVLDGYKKQMAGLLTVQKDNGIWMQLLDSKDAKNWEETSGTAMFLFAMFTGLKNGWLDSATFLEPAKKGWMALVGYLQGAKLANVAAGFWPSTGGASDYLNAAKGAAGDPHGTAAFLWAATAAYDYFANPVTGTAGGGLEFPAMPKTFYSPDGSRTTTVFDLMGRSIPVRSTAPAPAGLLVGRSVSGGAATLQIRQ